MNGLGFLLPSALERVWATTLAAADSFLLGALRKFDEAKVRYPFIGRSAYAHLEVQGDQ